jgi:pimeloyl-ACP methyl ester carboxylesterase
MAQRGTVRQPGKIVTVVLDAIKRAQSAASDEDPRLLLVGHSMGGIILYDIVSHFAPDLRVDALITVGSQVGVLEEAKVFQASDPGVPSPAQPKVAMPGMVAHWINVFDLNDPASFLVAPLFDGAADYRFESGLSPRAAHSAYFVRPSFYQRLHERLAEAWA